MLISSRTITAEQFIAFSIDYLFISIFLLANTLRRFTPFILCVPYYALYGNLSRNMANHLKHLILVALSNNQ